MEMGSFFLMKVASELVRAGSARPQFGFGDGGQLLFATLASRRLVSDGRPAGRARLKCGGGNGVRIVERLSYVFFYISTTYCGFEHKKARVNRYIWCTLEPILMGWVE